MMIEFIIPAELVIGVVCLVFGAVIGWTTRDRVAWEEFRAGLERWR